MSNSPTVGLLYPGEMGSALARLLAARGVRVVTTLQGRSERTCELAREAGIGVLDSLAQVVRQSDVVISLVAPSAAGEVAGAYCQLAHHSPENTIYVDANSIGPILCKALAAQVSGHGRHFVDASIHGLAKNLRSGATLYLSGQRAGTIAALIGDAMPVRQFGPEPGKASAMKMALGALSKGTCALLMEVGLLAARQDLLAEVLEEAVRFYPAVMAMGERLLPTYPVHAVRRAAEMHELEITARAVAQEPCMIDAIRRLLERLAGMPFDPKTDWSDQNMVALIGYLSEHAFLKDSSLPMLNQTTVD